MELGKTSKFIIYSLACLLNGMALGASQNILWITVGVVALVVLSLSNPLAKED